MIRLLIFAICLCVMPSLADAQTPGIDPRGLAISSSQVIIGVVEEPWQRVVRPDKIPKSGKITRQADGTFIAELPKMRSDYVVGYISHVRVQEILKGDKWVRENEILRVFVPNDMEDGVSLPTKQRFLLALTRFEPKKGDFTATSVSKVGAPLTKPGVPFDLQARYYSVAGGRNGAISVTSEHRKLIEEIKEAVHKAH